MESLGRGTHLCFGPRPSATPVPGPCVAALVETAQYLAAPNPMNLSMAFYLRPGHSLPAVQLRSCLTLSSYDSGTVSRNRAIDGLRGIAIAAVVCMHAFGDPIGGAAGVDLFFVLSGYLITRILVQERERTGEVDIWAYYVRRSRRIVPALLVMLAVFAAAEIASGHDPAIAIAGPLTFSSDAMFAFSHDTPWQLGPMWSLAVEE